MKKYLGIEFGSTRIKAALIEENGGVIGIGVHEWENKLTGGYWSYDLSDVVAGMQNCYRDLVKSVGKIESLGGVGVSAMMHGYLAFDDKYNLLTPFRTWRNTNTARASEELSEMLKFNMPQRWSAVHYYQAVLDNEAHIKKVAHLHTLSSYVHYLLTNENVIGVGDASGMFPIADKDYDRARINKYNAGLKAHGVDKDLYVLLPKVKLAGESAGKLTASGAKLLDPAGNLKAGVPVCPPEGDAGTGMVATNSVRARTGNVSAGTSAFSMTVLSEPLKNYYPEIDVVTTPSALPVAMVHVNNCSSEINEWVSLFGEAAELFGAKVGKGELYNKLFGISKESDENIGGLIGYNFLSGEPVVGLTEGRPMAIREPDGKMNLANFMQMQIYSALASLRIGTETLEREGVVVDEMCGHGGFFKTEYIGSAAMSAALNAPVTVMSSAGEGGAYGIALLSLYANKKNGTLEDFLDKIFAGAEKRTVTAPDGEKKKFAAFMERYKKYLAAEKAAAELR